MRDESMPDERRDDDVIDDAIGDVIVEKRGPRRIRRRTVVLATAAVLLSLVALIVGGVAVLTQTDRGRAAIMRVVVPAISATIPGTLYVGKVSGTLFTDITIDSIDIRSADGTPFLSSGPIRASYDPRDLLDRRIVVKSLEVTRPVITMVDYGNDDWNWKRALRRKGVFASKSTSRFGEFIVIDTTTIRELTFTARLPWILSDTLKGAKRDSALTYNLTRLDGEVRREGNHFVRVYRFVRGGLALGRSRFADPDSAGMRLAMRKMDVVWIYPPFWFRNMKGTMRRVSDTLWMDDVSFQLANSGAHGEAKVVWGSGLPVRYDVKLKGDSVAMSDMAWIDQTLPWSGGGSTFITIKNDPKNLAVLEYGLRDMDARALKSRLKGNMTFAVGGPVLRVNDVDLQLLPANTELLRWFNGEPFPYDWQGNVTGRVIARGGPVTNWKLDDAQLTYADAHVPGAVSRARVRGVVDIFTPADAILKGVDLELLQLDLRTPRFVNPLFPELNGFARGTMRLDSLWYDAYFSKADIEHVDGPGQPSRFTGDGHFTLLTEGVKFDVDLQAVPLSYTTMSRSYPSLPLRGSAVGRIKAAGMADQFEVQTILAGEGGELSFTGSADALEPEMGATGTWRLRGANLQNLLGDNRFPITSLSMLGTVDLSASTIETLRGSLRASVDQFSRVADARLFGGTAVVFFDSGHVRVDTLAIESSAVRLTAQGGLGITKARRDSLSISMVVDSMGGLRPWLSPTDANKRAFVLARDTLRGLIELSGQLSGSIDSTDAAGLDLRLRGDARDVIVATSRAQRASVDLAVRDVLRGANGSLSATMDSASFAGIDIASAAGQSTLRGGLAERFGVQMRTTSESRVAIAGGVARTGDSTVVTIDTLNLRVDSASVRPRGFALVAPARLRFMPGANGTQRETLGSLDSLVLQHTDTGRIAIRGGLAAGGAVSGQVDADRVALADIGRLLRTSGLARGTASAAITLSGTREQPQLDGTVDLRDAVAGRVRFGDLFAKAHYDSLRLNFDAALRLGGKPALQASASLPLDLALVANRKRQLDQPLTGRIVTEQTDLTLLESIFPDVTRARGTLFTDVALTGTWDRPRLRGGMRLENASLSLDNLGIRLDKARADIGLFGDSILIRRISATSGAPEDSIGISGSIGIREIANPSFNLRLAANEFQAIDKPRTASIVMTTTTPITLTGSRDAPRVQGAVRIDRGRVYIRALAQRRALDLTDNLDIIDTTRFGVNGLLPSAPRAIMQNLQLDNVRVSIGDDVWLRSPEANLKLGGGLRVTRALSRDGQVPRLALADSLTVDRGTYQLNLGIARPGFEVERGLVRFFGDPDLEPALDITALHTIRETRPNSNRQDVRIRVNIAGTIDRPMLALSSADNPPVPESDMLSYLVTGEPAYALLGTPYAEQGATLALRLAGSYLSSRLAGGRFDVVQVEPTALNPGDAANLRENGLGILASTRVGVGGQIARNTYFTFSTGLCGLSSQTSGGGDALSLFAQGLGVKVERRFDGGFSAALGLEPGSSAQACGRLGISRTFQQTPPQIGIDFFRSWTF
ncbi:translocation/assembly module TamB domain-containing protein [Gemmatimonas sp.]|uniref:translocation/assembly module TamB domain-containing protein n=1 Tax=Gemmatimonas sp. TaxID=1962908 RepID=UPI0039832CB3